MFLDIIITVLEHMRNTIIDTVVHARPKSTTSVDLDFIHIRTYFILTIGSMRHAYTAQNENRCDDSSNSITTITTIITTKSYKSVSSVLKFGHRELKSKYGKRPRLLNKSTPPPAINYINATEHIIPSPGRSSIRQIQCRELTRIILGWWWFESCILGQILPYR